MINFIINPTKQATEVCFSHKRDKVPHKRLTFSNNKIQSATAGKHLRLILNSKLEFNQHIDDKMDKCNKIIGTMRRFSITLSKKNLTNSIEIFC